MLPTRLPRLVCKIITVLQQTWCNYWYICYAHVFLVLFVLSAVVILLLGIIVHQIVTMVQAVLEIWTNGLTVMAPEPYNCVQRVFQVELYYSCIIGVEGV